MNRICLLIDRQGKVLSVREEGSDKLLEYKVRIVSDAEVRLYDMDSKINYVDSKLHFISPRCFGEILYEAQSIHVTENESMIRFPSACSYMFPAQSGPGGGCGLPMNFDYGKVFHMQQVDVGDASPHDLSEVLNHERTRCDRLEGYGHPGVTNNSGFLETLVGESCAEISDDILSVPYCDGWREKWYPVLREDGYVGVFRSEDHNGNVEHFVIVSTAAPFFVCDQIRALVEKNHVQWTWETWRTSAELKRAADMSLEAAKIICARVVAAMHKLGVTFKGKKTVTSQFNMLLSEATDKSSVVYDSGVIRSSQWSAQGALVSVGKNHEEFSWFRNQLSQQKGSWTHVLPGNRSTPALMPAHVADDDALETVRKRLACLRGVNLKVTKLENIELRGSVV